MMNNEEIERKMEFIAEQQAHVSKHVAQTVDVVNRLANVTYVGFNDLTAKINALVDAQIRSEETMKTLRDAQIRTDETMKALGDSQIRTEETMKALGDSQIRTDETMKVLVDAQIRTEETIKALGDAQIRTEESHARTEEALRNFIVETDRRFREDPNRN